MAGTEEPMRSRVLQEAKRLITGVRNVTYGTPTQNFTNIAAVWSVLLRHKLTEDLTAREVADLMIALKLCRNVAQSKCDTYVDIAGYAGCGAEAAGFTELTQ